METDFNLKITLPKIPDIELVGYLEPHPKGGYSIQTKKAFQHTKRVKDVLGVEYVKERFKGGRGD